MRRREFIAGIGGAAIAWPVVAGAQQPAKPPTIGYLGAYSQAIQAPWTDAFVKRLHELGWVDGRTITIATARRPRYSSRCRAQASW